MTIITLKFGLRFRVEIKLRVEGVHIAHLMGKEFLQVAHHSLLWLVSDLGGLRAHHLELHHLLTKEFHHVLHHSFGSLLLI
jgi:hypothetical protein